MPVLKMLVPILEFAGGYWKMPVLEIAGPGNAGTKNAGTENAGTENWNNTKKMLSTSNV